MEAKEWINKNRYNIEYYDEGGYQGIDEDVLAQMLEDYFNYRIKILSSNINKGID